MHNGNGHAAANGSCILDGRTVLITGGTGSFGKKFVEMVLARYRPRRLIVFSRDELKQFEMMQRFGDGNADGSPMRYFLGDVRDTDRLRRAFEGVDVVIHAAALKQVPAAEYNPLEAIKTNVMGGANVVDAALDAGVKKVIALSTDKAANPINLYGATKLCSDKLFVAGNSYAGSKNTRFSVVRYGNVMGSRGSVIPFFQKMRASGVLPVTDKRMTRFLIPLEQAVSFVIQSLDRMRGGEIFVPKIPSARILDIARAVAPECEIEVTGIRPGEKIHEVMVSEDDARQTLEFPGYYVIQPAFHWWTSETYQNGCSKPCPEGFRYSSDTNTRWMSVGEIRQMAGIEADRYEPVSATAD